MNKSLLLGILIGFSSAAILATVLYLTVFNPQKMIEKAANKIVDEQVESLKTKAKSKLQDYLNK